MKQDKKFKSKSDWLSKVPGSTDGTWDDAVEIQARIVSGQKKHRENLMRKWLVGSAKRRAGRQQGIGVTRPLGMNLTAAKTTESIPMRKG